MKNTVRQKLTLETAAVQKPGDPKWYACIEWTLGDNPKKRLLSTEAFDTPEAARVAADEGGVEIQERIEREIRAVGGTLGPVTTLTALQGGKVDPCN